MDKVTKGDTHNIQEESVKSGIEYVPSHPTLNPSFHTCNFFQSITLRLTPSLSTTYCLEYSRQRAGLS